MVTLIFSLRRKKRGIEILSQIIKGTGSKINEKKADDCRR
jgi:hypothetical protein